MYYQVLDWNGEPIGGDGFPSCRVVFESTTFSEALKVYHVITKNREKSAYMPIELISVEHANPIEGLNEAGIEKWYKSTLKKGYRNKPIKIKRLFKW